MTPVASQMGRPGRPHKESLMLVTLVAIAIALASVAGAWGLLKQAMSPEEIPPSVA